MEIRFLGGAGTVTGSKTLVESNGIRVLIDCGQFQGIKALRELNWKELPIAAETIDYVLLTHGHLDHCGWLPRLVAAGFRGKIYCTRPTRQVAELILLDSAKIQEEEAARANDGHYSRHTVAQPLYTIKQAEAVLPLFRVVKPHEEVPLDAEISASFFPAGHIIGACSITLKAEGKTLVFSGDIGRDDDVLMYPPEKPAHADYLFLESTYGNRLHPATDAKLLLEVFITNAIQKGGTVIIPGFAVERAQTIMYLLWQLKKEGRLPEVPLILDTPMGANVLDVFLENMAWHKLSQQECQDMLRLFRITSKYEETLAVAENPLPKVIIAASGMATGGRVLTYFERYIGIPETTVIFAGFQAEGTRGRKLLEGATEIKMYGQYYPVRASILQIEGLSAHGDQQDLIGWLSQLDNKPQNVFLVHGENQPADELRTKISERYHVDCTVPLMGTVVHL